MSQITTHNANRLTALAQTVRAAYAFSVTAAKLVEEYYETFKFAPVEGRSNEYVIHVKTPIRNANAEMEMTPADWDKFEKDIEDAFEQVP